MKYAARKLFEDFLRLLQLLPEMEPKQLLSSAGKSAGLGCSTDLLTQ